MMRSTALHGLLALDMAINRQFLEEARAKAYH
jgi:hypothetical protein